jgi:hypothetical protein
MGIEPGDILQGAGEAYPQHVPTRGDRGPSSGAGASGCDASGCVFVFVSLAIWFAVASAVVLVRERMQPSSRLPAVINLHGVVQTAASGRPAIGQVRLVWKRRDSNERLSGCCTYANVVISGKGFGARAPYAGDSNTLELFDAKAGFDLGWYHWDQGQNCWSGCSDTVPLSVSTWSDKRIVLTDLSVSNNPYRFPEQIYRHDVLRLRIWTATQAWTSDADGTCATFQFKVPSPP